MAFTDTQIDKLKAKLDPRHVKQRSQAGRQLSYLEGWHCIAEANRIFGFDEWTRETIYCREVCRVEVKIGQNQKPGWKVGYEAKVRVSVRGVFREGTGHGSGSMTDLFDAIESAAKEAETDAMKRALMTFGNPFGLALYDKEQANVGVPGMPAAEADVIEADIKDRIATVTDTETLDMLWRQTKARIAEVKHDHPEIGERIIGLFADKKKALLGQPNTVLAGG